MTPLAPVDWTTVRLGDIGDPLIGLTYQPSSVTPFGTLVLRSPNIQDHELAFEDNVYVDAAIPGQIRVRDGDILICVRNGSRALIGKSVRLDRRVVGETFGAFMAVFRSDANDYLDYYFQSDTFKQQIDQHLGATINQITNASLKSFIVALPPPAERDRIVGQLHDAAAMVSALQRQIAKKQDIKQGMAQRLLTGWTRLPGFDQAWADSTVGALARVIGGGTPSTRVPAYWGGGIPWFTPAEIDPEGSGLVSHSERTITPDGLANSSASLLPAGSVLVTSRASIGSCAVAEGPVTTNQGFTSMIPKDPRSTWFLYYWTQQNKSALQARAAGSTFVEISANKVAAIPIRQPSRDEQQAIGVVLRDADLELDLLGRRLDKAKAVKEGMAQQLLTGGIRLPELEPVA